jgi:hypothetical protein
MRRVTELWPSQWRRKRPPRTVYVGSHEDKLSRLAGMHIDPDDDGRTGEDVADEKAHSRRGAGAGGLTFYS